MKIISKRGKTVPKAQQTNEKETSTIITTDRFLTATPDEIKTAEEIFKEIRRQLEEIGRVLT